MTDSAPTPFETFLEDFVHREVEPSRPEEARFGEALADCLPPALADVARDSTAVWPTQWTPAALAKTLGAPRAAIRMVTPPWTPQRDEELLLLARLFRRWGARLPSDECICWIQPRGERMTVTKEEAEQMLGLVADVAVLEDDTLPDGTSCLVTAGRLRRASLGFILTWSRATVGSRSRLDALTRRLAGLGAAMRDGVHLLELPPGDPVDARWIAAVSRWLAAGVWRQADAAFGVYTPTMQGDVDAAMQALRAAASAAGLADRLLCHRVSTVSNLDEANAAVDRCRRLGLSFDCSVARWSPRGAATSYIDSAGYQPLECDARVPAATTRLGAPVVLPVADPDSLSDPRRDWWARLTTTPERAFVQSARTLADIAPGGRYDRLAVALDRGQRSAYLERLANDRTQVGEWHRYHVYNWAPPPPFLTAGFLIDADALAGRRSRARLLTEVPTAPPFATSRRMLEDARAASQQATAPGLAEQRRRQISGHTYLPTGRQTLTADSEQLVARLPAHLGRTLEIGFGYGVTACRMAGRASAYIGLDLQVEQGKALAEKGGRGVVGDIHALPFRTGAFDTVIADNVLEHASFPLAALGEIRRVLASNGAVYALIPLDAVARDFQIRTHLWKAAEDSLHEAARRSGLVASTEVLDLGRLGVFGCFPASAGTTCLVVFRPDGHSIDAVS